MKLSVTLLFPLRSIIIIFEYNAPPIGNRGELPVSKYGSDKRKTRVTTPEHLLETFLTFLPQLSFLHKMLYLLETLPSTYNILKTRIIK